MKKQSQILLLTALALPGCTAVSVNGLTQQASASNLCFEKNPRVYDEFLLKVETIVEKQGYQVFVYPAYQTPPSQCELIVKYTAKRSWDFATYLAYAEFKVYDLNGKSVAHGEYQHSGGLALNKWSSIENKLTPVLTELFPRR